MGGYKHSGGVKSLLSGVADMFSNHVMLNMRGKHNVPTSVGVVMSFFVILLVFGQASLSTYKMVFKKSPQILQLNEYENEPSIVYLNKTNYFTFAVALQIGDEYVDLQKGSPVTFTITSSEYRREGHTRTKIKNKIHFAPCNKTDFPEDVFGETAFDDFFLHKAYCPTGINYRQEGGYCPKVIEKKYPDCIMPPEIKLEGSYLSKLFQIMQANFYVCDSSNLEQEKPFGLHCLDLSETKRMFKANTEIKINLYYTNNKIDVNTYDAPVKTYFDVMHWRVDNRLVKWADIYIDKAVVQDHPYYISTGSKNVSTFTVDESQVREQQTTIEEADFLKTPLVKFNLRRSSLNLVTSRIYLKIQDILGQIGGMTKSLLFFFAFFVVGYAKYKYNMVVSNMLYDFDTSEIQERRRKTKLNNNNNNNNTKTGDYSLMKDEGPEQEGIRRRTSVSSRDPKEYVKDYFKIQENKKKGLKYNEGTYLQTLAFWKKKSNDQKLALKAWEKSEEDVDVILILKKLREIDKLKALLLDQSQRELFNYNPKPVIKGHDADSEEGEETTELFENNEEHYGKLFVAYREAKKNTDPEKEQYNAKLLQMLCPRLQKLFELVDDKIPQNASPEEFDDAIQRIMKDDNDDDAQKLDVSKDIVL